jgi:hypothetical protein
MSSWVMSIAAPGEGLGARRRLDVGMPMTVDSMAGLPFPIWAFGKNRVGTNEKGGHGGRLF